MLWVPPLGWEIGYFFWGWLTDQTLLRARTRMRAYRSLFALCMVLSLPLAVVPHLPPLFSVTLFMMFFAMFAAAGYIILAISYSTHVYSAADSGLIAGLGAGSWGAVVALAMPMFGRLFDSRSYGAAFLLAALSPVFGYTIWWYINREVIRNEKYKSTT